MFLRIISQLFLKNIHKSIFVLLKAAKEQFKMILKAVIFFN